MALIKEIFAMPLFPHLYAIPMSVVLGVAIGYYLRGVVDEAEHQHPKKPSILEKD